MTAHQDILCIDAKIMKSFKQEIEKLPIYKEKLLDLKKTADQINLTYRSRKTLNINIKNMEKKIDDIETHRVMYFYTAETADLLEKYKRILSTPIKLSFSGKSSRKNKEKSDIIYSYIEKALKYTDMHILNIPKSAKITCNNCVNKKFFDIIDNCIYICLSCGSQQKIILHTSSYKDVDRINMSQKYKYDRKVHFRDCIKQYQGKQNSTIDSIVFTKLEDQFEKHHLLQGNKKSLNKVKFKNITKEHIHIFLKELGYTKHYENVNLIHYQLTKIKPDDISYLEDKLLDDFDALTELYDKEFKNKPEFERKNFINTQYVLYQLLSKYKHPCKKGDFTILKTVDRKSFHDNVCGVLFSLLGWNLRAISF
jgi:hypothetical protein